MATVAHQLKGGIDLPPEALLTAGVANLRRVLRKLAKPSLLSFAVASVLSGSATFIAAGSMLRQSLSGDAFVLFLLLCWFAVAGLWQSAIVFSFAKRGPENRVGRRLFTYLAVHWITIAAVAVALLAVGAGVRLATGVLAFVASILIVVGAYVFLQASQSARLTGAVLAFVGVFLFLAADPNGLRFLDARGFLPPLVYQGFFRRGASATAAELAGGLQIGTLVVLGVAGLVHAVAADTKFRSVTWLVASVAALLYGLSVIVNGMQALTTNLWPPLSGMFPEVALFVVLAGLAVLVLTIAGFMIVGVSIVGIAVYTQELTNAFAPPATPAATAPQPSLGSTATTFCTGCGASLRLGAKFCGGCGVKAEGVS